MKIVEDPKILSAFEKEDEKEIDLKPGKLVEDENIITQFNKLENEEAIFHRNWVKQILIVLREYPKVKFLRVGTLDSYVPVEYINFKNFSSYDVTKFCNFFEPKPTV